MAELKRSMAAWESASDPHPNWDAVLNNENWLVGCILLAWSSVTILEVVINC